MSDRGVRRGRVPVLAAVALVLGCGGSVSDEAAGPDPRLLQAIDHYTGVAGRVDDDRAREVILQVAAETGSPLSRMWVARAASRGRLGVERDTVLARSLAAQVIDEVYALAQAGEVEAVFLMGTAFDEGLGRPIDYEEAVRWYRRAAEEGHVLAQHNLGNVYAAGRGIEQDFALAVRWWTPPAERGDAITQLRLGEAYEAGRGVEADTAAALAWFERAAALGNAAAAEAAARLREPGG